MLGQAKCFLSLDLCTRSCYACCVSGSLSCSHLANFLACRKGILNRLSQGGLCARLYHNNGLTFWTEVTKFKIILLVTFTVCDLYSPPGAGFCEAGTCPFYSLVGSSQPHPDRQGSTHVCQLEGQRERAMPRLEASCRPKLVVSTSFLALLQVLTEPQNFLPSPTPP